MTPTIGITTYSDHATWRNWSAPAAMLPWMYVDAVRRCGGRPVLLPPGGDSFEANITVAGQDGIVVVGGPDIDPARYGAARHPQTQAPAPVRDTWDFAVTRNALALGVPLLAICRGMQVLNVSQGGTLHQHVPDLVGHNRHEGPSNGFGAHRVRVSPDSMLARILPEPGHFGVPTHHHQAVDLLGEGLKAVAWEEDGLIEAVEAGPSELDGLPGFALGVQWHPEQSADLRLFAALVGAAAEHAAAYATTMLGSRFSTYNRLRKIVSTVKKSPSQQTLRRGAHHLRHDVSRPGGAGRQPRVGTIRGTLA